VQALQLDPADGRRSFESDHELLYTSESEFDPNCGRSREPHLRALLVLDERHVTSDCVVTE